MTYKLEPGLGRITSPVVLIFPDGETQSFISGAEACKAVFEKRWVVTEIRAVENVVEIKVEEAEVTGTTWAGEEQSFF